MSRHRECLPKRRASKKSRGHGIGCVMSFDTRHARKIRRAKRYAKENDVPLLAAVQALFGRKKR